MYELIEVIGSVPPAEPGRLAGRTARVTRCIELLDERGIDFGTVVKPNVVERLVGILVTRLLFDSRGHATDHGEHESDEEDDFHAFVASWSPLVHAADLAHDEIEAADLDLLFSRSSMGDGDRT